LKTVEVNSFRGFKSLSLRHEGTVRTPKAVLGAYFSFYQMLWNLF